MLRCVGSFLFQSKENSVFPRIACSIKLDLLSRGDFPLLNLAQPFGRLEVVNSSLKEVGNVTNSYCGIKLDQLIGKGVLTMLIIKQQRKLLKKESLESG